MSIDQTRSEIQFAKQPPHPMDRDIVASAAHELCNHLQVLASALGLLQRTVGDSASPATEIIFSGSQASLDRANHLARRIVDGGGCAADPVESRTSIAQRLAALRDVILLATGPAILVEFAVASDVPDVLCPEDGLDDAILNVVVNAAHAMPGGGRILITAMCDYGARGIFPSAVICIADTGCGMSEEIAARAFEPRFTTKPHGEGSGVGLAKVASFARDAGGTAEIESCPDRGTIITIRLPGMLKNAKVKL